MVSNWYIKVMRKIYKLVAHYTVYERFEWQRDGQLLQFGGKD